MKRKEIAISYTTRDLFEASAIAVYVKPINLINAGNYFLFEFPKEPAEGLSMKYWAGELTGSYRDYANSMKSLKDWLFSVQVRLTSLMLLSLGLLSLLNNFLSNQII